MTTDYVTALKWADVFFRISFKHVPRVENHEANEMAQKASDMNIPDGEYNCVIKIEKRTLPALAKHGMLVPSWRLIWLLQLKKINETLLSAIFDIRRPMKRSLKDLELVDI